MKCTNCGKDIPDNASFCKYCGARVTARPAAPAAAPAPGPARPDLSGLKSALSSGGVKLLFVVLAALHVLQLIFWFTPFLKASASLFGMKAEETASMAELCAEDSSTEAFTIIFVVLFIAAALVALIPVVNKKVRRRRMIFSKIVAISTFGMMMLFNNLVREDARADIGFAFTGWLYLLVTIGIFAFTMYISYRTKQPKKAKTPAAPRA